MRRMRTFVGLFFISSFISVFFASCTSLEGKDDLVFESRSLPELEGLRVCIPADILIFPSDSSYFKISAPKNVLPNLIFQMKNGVFNVLSFKRLERSEITISVYGNQIREVIASEGANIQSMDCLEFCDQFNISMGNDAFLDLEVNADKVIVNDSGCGVLVLKGETNLLNFTSSGEGELKALELQANVVGVSSRGSTVCYVSPNDIMHVNIEGEGDIYYTGDPKIHSMITGTGNLLKVNK